MKIHLLVSGFLYLALSLCGNALTTTATAAAKCVSFPTATYCEPTTPPYCLAKKQASLEGIIFDSQIKYKNLESKPNSALEAALKKVYNIAPNDYRFSYYYTNIDLNNDENPETIVYLTGLLFSGSGGNSAVIFTNKCGEYFPVVKLSLVNTPIIISSSTTNAWHDLIIPVHGGGIKSFFAELKFDGKTYPSNPSTAPHLEPGRRIAGTAVVADEIHCFKGLHSR